MDGGLILGKLGGLQGGSSRLCGSGERQLRQLGGSAPSASGERDGGGLPEFTEMVLRGSV